MSSTEKVPEHHRQWLDTIKRAARNGDFAPLAHLPDSNPFDYFKSVAG